MTSSSPQLDAVRFSIKSLFLLTFLCAVGIALVKQFHLAGTVILFIVAGVASIVMLRRGDFAERRFWLQATWGVLLPLSCLFTDPMVFRDFDFEGGPLSPSTVACYCFISWQMLMLAASWFLKPTQARWGSFVAGNLIAGSLFAAGVALFLVIPAILFSFVIIGLPGLTPWFTMIAFFRGYQYCWRVGSQAESPSVKYGLAGLGCLVSISIGVAAYFAWSAYPIV